MRSSTALRESPCEPSLISFGIGGLMVPPQQNKYIVFTTSIRGIMCSLSFDFCLLKIMEVGSLHKKQTDCFLVAIKIIV